MGGRFYCDYCDSSFPDSTINRRNHFKGFQHQQAKKLHYDEFLSPTEKLITERAKKPCNSFRNTGICNYGPLCRYSHLTPMELRALDEQSRLTNQVHVDQQLNLLESNLLKRLSNSSKCGKGRKFTVPKGYEYVDLPPSLCYDCA